jgi:peptide deformylase
MLEIIKLDNELLRQVSEPVKEVNDEIRTLISEMFETMDAAEGVGLAAPQVGKLLRLFVLQADDGIRRAFINPQIIATSAETCEYEEGCLSIPKAYETIVRPAKVTVQALNENGKPFTLEADGFLARIIQHEYDHLDGFLYIDRGDEETKQRIIETFNRRKARKAEKERLKAKKAAKIANKNSKQG